MVSGSVKVKFLNAYEDGDSVTIRVTPARLASFIASVPSDSIKGVTTEFKDHITFMNEKRKKELGDLLRDLILELT